MGIKKCGNSVTVPSEASAKLMYYLDCICYVLDLSGMQNLNRLRYDKVHQ